VRVAVNDRVAPGKRGCEPRRPPYGGPGHVHHPDPSPRNADDPPFRQELQERRLVHVPCHSLDRRQPPELLEHRSANEVTGVQDQLGALQSAQALTRQPPRSARHVRVGDDRDERQPAPFRNAPSR
jgi:hypothetical protein